MSLVQTGEQLGCHKSIGHLRAEVINDQQITVVDILVESGEGFLSPGVKSITRKGIIYPGSTELDHGMPALQQFTGDASRQKAFASTYCTIKE